MSWTRASHGRPCTCLRSSWARMIYKYAHSNSRTSGPLAHEDRPHPAARGHPPSARCHDVGRRPHLHRGRWGPKAGSQRSRVAAAISFSRTASVGPSSPQDVRRPQKTPSFDRRLIAAIPVQAPCRRLRPRSRLRMSTTATRLPDRRRSSPRPIVQRPASSMR
jgi:hypothetical protein